MPGRLFSARQPEGLSENGFPKDTALDVALSEIGKFLLTHDMNITLVVFDKAAFELSEKLMGEIRQFIDEQTAVSLREQERFHGNLRMNTRSVLFEEERRRALSRLRGAGRRTGTDDARRPVP